MKEQGHVHTAQKYIEILSDSLSSFSSDDSSETSLDESSDLDTRKKPIKHLTYYIEVYPYLQELCFDILFLIDMTQWKQYWILKKFFFFLFVFIYYQLMSHGTILFSFVHVR